MRTITVSALWLIAGALFIIMLSGFLVWHFFNLFWRFLNDIFAAVGEAALELSDE
jgi:hypothetical protein